MATANERIRDETISYAVRLDRFTADMNQKVQGHLWELQEDIEAQLLKARIPDQPDSRQVRRLEALLEQVNETIAATYSEEIWPEQQRELRELSSVANLQGARTLNVGFETNITTPQLTPVELRVLSNDPIVRGRPSSEWWDGQSENLKSRFASEMRLGIQQGESNDKLIKRVIGELTGNAVEVEIDGKKQKVPERKGGIMDVSRREAEALVRTSAQTVSNETLMESYRANARLLRGVAALVTLDSRTTDICMSRSGGIWDVTTSEPLPESTRQEPMPPPPPWHWNCRSTFMPVTKSWDELRKGRGQDRLPASDRRKLDTQPRSTRQSMDGKVPGNLNFEQWLKTKDRAFQMQQLGPERWKLWDDGKIKLSQLTDFSGRPLTLRELREASEG